MAQTATIYIFEIELSDMDRQVYEVLELRVARHPSESAEYMLVRVLAYCLEHVEGITFTQGLSSGEEPAIVVRDLTGRLTAWIEVGHPDAERLHRASKAAERVAVYTHREAGQLLQQYAGKTIYRAEAIPVYSFDRRFIEALVELVDRRTALTLSVTERELYLGLAGQTLSTTLAEHRIR